MKPASLVFLLLSGAAAAIAAAPADTPPILREVKRIVVLGDSIT